MTLRAALPQLTKTQLSHHRAWLSEWRKPLEMADYVAAANVAMGSAAFFRQGGVAFLRDAWLAAKFGHHRQADLVRLIPEREQWPDFEAQIRGVIERVKCVEADIPNRRRSDEYREAKKQTAAGKPVVEDDPVEDWIARADQVPAALLEAVTKKVAKHHAGEASLLVYLNINEFGIRQAEIEAVMRPAMAPALPCFQRAWILWKDRLYEPWAATYP